MWKDKPQQPTPILAVLKDPDGEVIFQIDPAGVGEPAGVGILLVDLARHYARMFALTGKARSEELALADIRQVFDAEWDRPTDLGHGGIPN